MFETARSSAALAVLPQRERERGTAGDVGFTVAAIGLSQRDRHTLHAVFALSKGRRPRVTPYKFSVEICNDLFVINADSPDGLRAWRAYRQFHPDRAHTPTVYVGHSRPPDLDGQFLPRPLIVTRLLAQLERVAAEHLGYVPTLAIETNESAPAQSLQRSLADNRPIRALVVDDSLPVRVQLKRALEGMAERLDFAETGEMALDLVRRHRYDIAFVDIVLPGIDGYDVCERIKQDPDTAATQVVMVTSNSSPADRIRGELAGCDTYLIKPVRMQVFENVLRELLPGRQVPPSGDVEPAANSV